MPGLARRHRLAVAGVVLVLVLAVVAAILVVVLPSPGYGEQVSGPFGSVPRALPATGEPRVIARYYGSVLVDGGMALVGNGNKVPAAQGTGTVSVTDGIAAVNLATHRLFWSYRRPGHTVAGLTEGPDALYVLWDDGLLARLNPATAAIAWHYQAPSAYPAIEMQTGHLSGMVTAGNTVALAVGADGSYDKIYGVNATTGAGLWTVAPPAGCGFNGDWLAVTPSVLAVNTAPRTTATCNEMQAYSLTSGKPLWHRPAGLEVPLAADDGTIIGAGSGRGAGMATLNATTGRQENVIQDATGNDLNRAYSTQDGLVAQWAAPDPRFGVADVHTGKVRWTRTLPAGYDPGSGYPEFAGANRVYLALSSNDGPKISDVPGSKTTLPSARLWLYGYDSATGKAVSKTALPVILPSGLSDPGGIAEYRYSANAQVTGTGPGVAVVTEISASDGGYGDQRSPTLVVAG